MIYFVICWTMLMIAHPVIVLAVGKQSIIISAPLLSLPNKWVHAECQVITHFTNHILPRSFCCSVSPCQRVKYSSEE